MIIRIIIPLPQAVNDPFQLATWKAHGSCIQIPKAILTQPISDIQIVIRISNNDFGMPGIVRTTRRGGITVIYWHMYNFLHAIHTS